MSPTPTGRLLGTTTGEQLHLTREFRAPIEDVWASITESERTGRWFASWSGEGRAGATVRIRLEHEEGRPESELQIVACDAPNRLAVTADDEHGSWRLEARLAEHDGVTTLTLVHHLAPEIDLGSTGPGWEYYLDMLVASREGTDHAADRVRPGLDFDDYYPSMKAYYESLVAEESVVVEESLVVD